MMRQVLGFAFDDLGRVALIRKNRPEWQRGKLNGVGGTIEANESGPKAMSREFFEETGVSIDPEKWRWRGTMTGDGWQVLVYTATDEAVRMARTTTDEHVNLYIAHAVPRERHMCIENVPLLIELCALQPAAPSNIAPSFVLRY